MKKVSMLRFSYSANAKLFFYRIPNAIFCIVFLIIAILGTVIINKLTSTHNYTRSKTELMTEYATFKETAQKTIDIIEGRAITEQPYDDRPEYAAALKDNISLYDYYLSTDTCENDYIILNESFVNWWTLEAKQKAFSALNVVFIFGLVFVVLSILMGSICYKPFFSRNKLFMSGNVSKSTLIKGRTLFLWTILATFILFTLIAAFIIIDKSPVKTMLTVKNANVLTQSVYLLIFSRILFFTAVGFFFYNFTTLLNNVTKKSTLAFIISLIVFIGFIGISRLISLFTDYYYSFCVIPITGLLFNSKGFLDYTAYYNFPLAIIAGIVLYFVSRKKFEVIEF